MPKPIYEWSANENKNGFTPADGGTPELMLRSDVNNASRARMAATRDYYNEPEFLRIGFQGPDPSEQATFTRDSATVCRLTLTGIDLTSWFEAGRIVRVQDGLGAGVELIAQVVSASYDAISDTTITITADMDVASTYIDPHSMAHLRALSLVDNTELFFIPAGPTGADIQVAIDNADAAGGGRVLLTLPEYLVSTQIVFTPTNSVTISASASGTDIKMADATNLASIMIMGASNTPEIQGCTFDANQTNNAGDGVCLIVDGPTFGSINRCGFDDSIICIKITSVFCLELAISDCAFRDFTEFGIDTTSVNDQHIGRVNGCSFDLVSVDALQCGGMRLAGRWAVSDNSLYNVDHASASVRGVWFWNQTAAGNGGFRCSATGNQISGSATELGTIRGIEVGGSDCVIGGNVINVSNSSPNAVGIYVENESGGDIVRGTITGNVIIGTDGIYLRQFSRSITVSGNTMTCQNRSIIADSDNGALISTNVCWGGLIGVEVGINAVWVTISGNHFDHQSGILSAGVSILGGANDTSVIGNRIIGLPNTGVRIAALSLSNFIKDNDISSSAGSILTNESTETFAMRNTPLAVTTDRHIEIDIANWDAGGIGVMNAIPGLEGLEFPGLAASGVWLWTSQVELEASGGDNATLLVFRINLHVGPLGTISDPVVAFSDTPPNSNNATTVGTDLVGFRFLESNATHLYSLSSEQESGTGTGTASLLFSDMARINE